VTRRSEFVWSFFSIETGSGIAICDEYMLFHCNGSEQRGR
jgi:hypothetical protein